MSYIGEARMFRQHAQELREKAAKEPDPDKREELLDLAREHDRDASACWEMARQECEQD